MLVSAVNVTSNAATAASASTYYSRTGGALMSDWFRKAWRVTFAGYKENSGGATPPVLAVDDDSTLTGANARAVVCTGDAATDDSSARACGDSTFIAPPVVADSLGGSFTLAFGSLSRPLPGVVGAVNGSTTLFTTEDLSSILREGDQLAVGAALLGDEYTSLLNNPTRVFDIAKGGVGDSTVTITRPFFASAATYGSGGSSRAGPVGAGQVGLTMYRRPRTPLLRWNASADEVRGAIEALNRFNEKQEASESSPLAAEIQQLADMKEKGLLTDEEYSAAKAKLLGL